MSYQGFGHCAHLPRYQYVAAGCDRLKQAEPEVIAARFAWAEKLKVSDERYVKGLTVTRNDIE